QITTTPAPLPTTPTSLQDHPPTPPSGRVVGRPLPFLYSRQVFWGLFVLGMVLNVAVIGWAGWLIFHARSVAPPADRKIIVPYAGNKELWERYHTFPVMNDGRVKPFDTFARESVRFVTGREKFEGNDPSAVVMSWMMTCDPTDNNVS